MQFYAINQKREKNIDQQCKREQSITSHHCTNHRRKKKVLEQFYHRYPRAQKKITSGTTERQMRQLPKSAKKGKKKQPNGREGQKRTSKGQGKGKEEPRGAGKGRKGREGEGKEPRGQPTNEPTHYGRPAQEKHPRTEQAKAP